MNRVLTAVAVLAWLLPAAGASASDSDVYGVWRNPKDSVHLDVRPCGASACGVVIWASEKAQAAALKGSGHPLLGQQLLRDFVLEDGAWRGRVYAPDLDRTFSGSAKLLDHKRLEARGCLLGRILCKRQVWTRLDRGA